MNDKSYFKFERGTRAPDGIHDADLRANDIPVSVRDILYVTIIGLLYLAVGTMSYYWG